MTAASRAPQAEPFEGVLRGRWLWDGRSLLERGGVVIQGGRVAAVLTGADPDPPGAALRDLRKALIHPGLLNAHVHLDLCRLGKGKPQKLAFPAWLAKVRESRASAGADGMAAAARDGVAELARGGVTRLVDFSYGGHSETAILESGLRAAVLKEVIGADTQRSAAALPEARDWLDSKRPGDLVTYGLAPHSPYLATPTVIEECRRLALGRPFSIHAAELPGESDLLRLGTGEMRQFLMDAGVDLRGFVPSGVGPIEHLERLGVLRGTLVVHAGILEPSDFDRLVAGGAGVIFCPRSHRYFDRPAHPLLELLRRGIPAALGTDSAASNWGLSVADEMREVRRQFPSLPAPDVFALGTGAHLDGNFGLPWTAGLEAGSVADLAAAKLPRKAPDPLETFLSDEVPHLLTMVAGRVVYEA